MSDWATLPRFPYTRWRSCQYNQWGLSCSSSHHAGDVYYKGAQLYPTYSGSSPLAAGQAQISWRDVHRRGSISPHHLASARNLLPPPLLWSTGSRLPPQLVRQNGVRSIHKIKPCLKVISYASSHTELSAQPSSSPDVAERLTAAVSTRSLRYQFNHRLTGTDSYRNSSFGHKSLLTSLLSLLHPTWQLPSRQLDWPHCLRAPEDGSRVPSGPL